MTCTTLPNCDRCGQVACAHTGFIPSISGTCIGYIGLRDCLRCGRMSWLHDEAAPHAIEGKCEGYDGGEEPQPFNGEGGGYGGGGASGGW